MVLKVSACHCYISACHFRANHTFLDRAITLKAAFDFHCCHKDIVWELAAHSAISLLDVFSHFSSLTSLGLWSILDATATKVSLSKWSQTEIAVQHDNNVTLAGGWQWSLLDCPTTLARATSIFERQLPHSSCYNRCLQDHILSR